MVIGVAVPSTHGNCTELPLIEFVIKPKVCVLRDEQELCLDELEITWQSPHELNLCLYQKHTKSPLLCWEQSRQGRHTMALNTNVSLEFLLKESFRGELLANETFEVIHDHKQYRRARRNAWAFF